MAQLIKPNSVKIITQDGEVKVTIALELTINLNSDGIKVSATAETQKNEPFIPKNKTEDKTLWEIPDFGIAPKVGFGKKE